MTDILDLENWKAISVTKTDDVQTIEAEYLIQPLFCIKCGALDSLYRHGTKPVIYRDSPIRGLPVAIKAILKRYKCKSCGSTFLQPVTGIYPDTRMTERCVSYIQKQCLKDTFTHISNHLGCDEKTVRNVSTEYIQQLNHEYRPSLPEWLGIDETTIDGKLRCVFTDVLKRTPIDMIQDRDKASVIAWLSQFKSPIVIKGVAIDMWRPYLDAVNTVFPGIPVVIDKFHVVRMANNGLEKTRIALAKTKPKPVRVDWKRQKSLLRLRGEKLNQKQDFNLSMWLDNEPEVAVAYQLKESFYAIYDCKDRFSAQAMLHEWIASVPKELNLYFKELLSALKNWETQILAYFDDRVTNGYTEALNGIAKQINRAGRGYNFETLRAKLLFHKNQNLKNIQPVDSLLDDNFSKFTCWSCGSISYVKGITFHQISIRLGGAVTEMNTCHLCQECSNRIHTKE